MMPHRSMAAIAAADHLGSQGQAQLRWQLQPFVQLRDGATLTESQLVVVQAFSFHRHYRRRKSSPPVKGGVLQSKCVPLNSIV